VEDEREAKLLAKQCGRRMYGIVLQNQPAFDRYFELLKNNKTGVYPKLSSVFLLLSVILSLKTKQIFDVYGQYVTIFKE
jgi:hypothetical protein